MEGVCYRILLFYGSNPLKIIDNVVKYKKIYIMDGILSFFT